MTTTSVKKTIGNYADSVYYGPVDTSGVLIGATATPPAAGDADGSAMAQLLHVQNFPFEPVDPDMPTQKGDGGVAARFINKPTDLPASDLVFGSSDYDFWALCQTIKVATHGGGRFILNQPRNPTFADLLMLAIAPAKSQEDASLNAGHWEARLILKAMIAPKMRNAFVTDALPTYGYKMTANYANAYPWGTAFDVAVEGDTQGVGLEFTWPYRPILQRWTGNNVLTTYHLAHKIAEDSADNIVVIVNGVPLTYAAGVPGVGQFGITVNGAGVADDLVFNAAPAAAAKIVALFGRL